MLTIIQEGTGGACSFSGWVEEVCGGGLGMHVSRRCRAYACISRSFPPIRSLRNAWSTWVDQFDGSSLCPSFHILFSFLCFPVFRCSQFLGGIQPATLFAHLGESVHIWVAGFLRSHALHGIYICTSACRLRRLPWFRIVAIVSCFSFCFCCRFFLTGVLLLRDRAASVA